MLEFQRSDLTKAVAATTVASVPSLDVQMDWQLTEREIEVLTWVAHGKSNSAIASILGISSHTVDTYVRRVMQKFEVASRTTAAVRAAQYGLLPRI